MHVLAHARLALARRPYLYWAIVAALAVLAVAGVHRQNASIANERDRWGTTRTALVARRQLEPGDLVDATIVELPLAALPDQALDALDVGARVRQRVGAGEVLTILDVTPRHGPASTAEPGTVVVALADPLARDLTSGISVQVAADGFVLADGANITAVVDDVIFVAVDRHDGPTVAAAARQGTASLLYLP